MRRQAVLPILFLTGALLAGCAGEAAESSTTEPFPSTAAPTAWQEVPGWAEPLLDWMEAYRTALASGDVEEVFPFLAEDIAWWSGRTGDRLRMGLRDVLLGLDASGPDVRSPGRVFVLAYPFGDGFGYDIEWLHAAGTGDSLRVEVIHLGLRNGGVTDHGVRSLVAQSDGSPELLERITARYEEIAERFSSADAEYAAEMMSERPVWLNTPDGMVRVDPREIWVREVGPAFAAAPDARMTPITTADLDLPGPELPLVFFTPPVATLVYDEETIGGIGVYRWEPAPGDERLAVIEWMEQAHGIVEFQFKVAPESFHIVLPDEANPWLADPSIWPDPPGPARVETGSIDLNGHTVTVYNGSPSRRALVEWALERYIAAGLPPPSPASVTFPPTADCILYSGLAIDTGDGVDLVLCFTDAEVCADPDCTPTLAARSTLLHELGHVWTVQNVDDATRRAFLAERGLEVWGGSGVPWDEQGTEHAAEILSWALIETDSLPARLPGSDCEDLAAGYRALTGLDPPRDCD